MTERIHGSGLRPTDTASTRRADASKAARGGAAERGAPSAGPAGDTVNLTRSGVLMGKLADVVHNAPIVDAERVRAAKDAIASGRYAVNEQAVADKMLKLDRELVA